MRDRSSGMRSLSLIAHWLSKGSQSLSRSVRGFERKRASLKASPDPSSSSSGCLAAGLPDTIEQGHFLRRFPERISTEMSDR